MKTRTQQVQKILDLVGILLLGYLKRKAMNLALQNRYCLGYEPLGPHVKFFSPQAKMAWRQVKFAISESSQLS